MRASDLSHDELLQLDPNGGVIRFAGQRALLLDAVAMGLLRKYLIEQFGTTAARIVLTQFGFAHGWRMAEALQTQLSWDNAEEWTRAGLRVPALGGLFHMNMTSDSPLSQNGTVLDASYEAEQHLLHFGQSDEPVCWTLSGLMSGYLSKTTGKEIYVLEDCCSCAGHAACHIFGRTREAWGEERADELQFFAPTRLTDCLDVSLQRITETLKETERKLRAQKRVLKSVSTIAEAPQGIIVNSEAMRRVVDLAQRVAKFDSTVVITGESGTGKERIARMLHNESARADGPFIAINCGAITETLLESELFGHARGAFTGAAQDRPGFFEAANGGTLLLDEINSVSSGMQVKLLRAIQEREVRRVGENKVRPIDVRVIAATNSDLAEAVAAGTFREDLYYRLNVVEIRVPALRDRRDDILPLARVLLADAARRMQRPGFRLAPSAAAPLLHYRWPGNVRELGNAMERGIALASGDRLELDDLPPEVRSVAPETTAIVGAVRRLADIEKDYILAALNANKGNQTHTAEQLAIGSATLYRKLKGYAATAASAEAERA